MSVFNGDLLITAGPTPISKYLQIRRHLMETRACSHEMFGGVESSVFMTDVFAQSFFQFSIPLVNDLMAKSKKDKDRDSKTKKDPKVKKDSKNKRKSKKKRESSSSSSGSSSSSTDSQIQVAHSAAASFGLTLDSAWWGLGTGMSVSFKMIRNLKDWFPKTNGFSST